VAGTDITNLIIVISVPTIFFSPKRQPKEEEEADPDELPEDVEDQFPGP